MLFLKANLSSDLVFFYNSASQFDLSNQREIFLLFLKTISNLSHFFLSSEMNDNFLKEYVVLRIESFL
jgi:hypothetical protein